MSSADLGRFKRILGMLGSDQAGERAAAALLATNWLTERGLGWSDVSVPGRAAVPSSEPVAGAGRPAPPAEPDMMQAAREAREAMEAAEARQRERNKHSREAILRRRARWEQNADQPDADGFHGGRK